MQPVVKPYIGHYRDMQPVSIAPVTWMMTADPLMRWNCLLSSLARNQRCRKTILCMISVCRVSLSTCLCGSFRNTWGETGKRASAEHRHGDGDAGSTGSQTFTSTEHGNLPVTPAVRCDQVEMASSSTPRLTP